VILAVWPTTDGPEIVQARGPEPTAPATPPHPPNPWRHTRDITMTVDEEDRRFRSVTAILEEAGVVMLPEWSTGPGRVEVTEWNERVPRDRS
jgi:hypothetical protein